MCGGSSSSVEQDKSINIMVAKKHLRDLNYFERILLIDNIARSLASRQGWKINNELYLISSNNPRIKAYVELAKLAIQETEIFLEED